ncbi:cold shock domain-containing protein [Candidatus Pacearchaeota archaeon]|nr:cold shock domain-containing protein [Candidatus Pacearchaeota archaeon]
MKGKIKFYNEIKGFGFVTGEDGKDYFVHSTSLEGSTSLAKDDEVTFETEQGDKGLKAVKVAKA